MKRYGFEWKFGAVLLALFLAFSLWQNPGLTQGKLTRDDIDRYLATIERTLPMPPGERTQFLARLRAWAEADDGNPVYMLNLMRLREQLHTFPGAPEFAGTPQQANAYYERGAVPLMVKNGGYPMLSAAAQGKNLVGSEPAVDDWSRALVVRQPSRRAFLDFMADPAYAPYEPYKLMAFQTFIVPLSVEILLPNLQFVLGAALLVIFLATGWLRAARRSGPSGVTR
jgi:hypothetical protein